MNARIIGALLTALICITMAAPTMAQPSPFVITGHVFDSDGSPCNGAWVRVTNTNTSVSWDVENSSASNYYRLVLDSEDVSAGNVLRFEASGCSESKIEERTVTQSEMEYGGFDFDIVFYVESMPDLTVTAIGTPVSLRKDVINPISATVENMGSENATSFNVTLEAGGSIVDTATVTSLNASEDTTVEFLWTPSSTGGCTLNVTADANGAVIESDETNNSHIATETVLDTLTATVNVRIEGKDDTVWCGDVTFSSSVLTASDGSIHYLNEPTALGALDEANKSGGFGYVLENGVWGLYVPEINSEPPIGWDGWMYRVDYVSPWVGAGEYTLYGGEDVLWYFGAWTAPPLAIELSATDVSPGEEFVATVTAYNDTSAAFEPVDEAEVYIDGGLYGLTEDGLLTISIDTAGSYQIHADKGTWADYTRSEMKAVTVLSVESYGESVYAKKNTRFAWRALDEPDDVGAVLFRNAKIVIELEETIPACKDVTVRVSRLGFRTVNFDVAVSPDGTNWIKIGSESINSWMTWEDYDFNGDFGDVKYIKITKPGTRWKPRIMGLDAVYAKN